MTIGERPTRASPYPKPKHIRRVLTECIRGSRDDPQFTTKMTAAAAAFESNSVLPLCPPGDAGKLYCSLSPFIEVGEVNWEYL